MNPADLALPTISPSLTSKALPALQSSAQKNGKLPIPRVDLEPIYTQLKAALGDQWAEYKAAINAFVLGQLNQAELTWVLQPLLSPALSVLVSADPARSPLSTLHLHNTLLISIHANLARDAPPTEVAPWVVATDKPTTSAKQAGAGAGGQNDKVEERLKKETMSLHARDRRRLKALKADKDRPSEDGGLREVLDYRYELAVKPPDGLVPQSAGALPRSNEIESRRKYAQPLASETLEFPAPDAIQTRIESIAAEEGLNPNNQSAYQNFADYAEQAAEVFVKEFLGSLWSHARSNGEGCIQTSKYKRQLRKEEQDAEDGRVQRNPAGLLPVELQMMAERQSLDMFDLRLGLLNHDPYLLQDPFLVEASMLNQYPQSKPMANGFSGGRVASGGPVGGVDADAMAVDNDLGWKGGTTESVSALGGVLDDCLAVG